MSRVGNLVIQIPQSVQVEIEGQKIAVKGPLGELSTHFPSQLKVVAEEQQLLVKRNKEDSLSRSLHGLNRTLIANMVQGVEKGWEKKLELVGVGYRAQLNGEKLILNVGYSHPVEVDAPEGIRFTVADNTKIAVSGIDKSLVGQVAATIRKVRPPEPYQGKGIRYSGEYVRRKAGKAGKVGAGAK